MKPQPLHLKPKPLHLKPKPLQWEWKADAAVKARVRRSNAVAPKNDEEVAVEQRSEDTKR
jgi:hypothetical protein